MNTVHLHLMLNHLPVLGTAFGLALFLFGMMRRSADVKKAALGVLVIAALATVPVYLTGEPAEDAVESLPGVAKPFVEQHEEAAGVAFGGVLVAGVVALAGLFLFRQPRVVPGWFNVLVLITALGATGLMAWAAGLGGQVRHTEIRPQTASMSVPKGRH